MMRLFIYFVKPLSMSAMKQKMSWSACWSCTMTTQPTWPMMKWPLSERTWRAEGSKWTRCWWEPPPAFVLIVWYSEDKYTFFILQKATMVKIFGNTLYFLLPAVNQNFLFLALIRSRTHGTSCIADTSCRMRCPTVTSAREASTTTRDTLLILR